jgi:DNA-binding transcriptional LysR family regulator
MDRLQSMRVFQTVVDEGGFAAAARKLDLAPAVVTRLVGDLEKYLGVRLLQRTTRRLSLTNAGEAYLARLRPILGDIDEASAVAHANTKEMDGLLRICAPPVAATHILAPLVAGFRQLHPGVRFDIHAEDSVNPQVEEYDLTIVTATAQLDSSVIVRTIIQGHAVLCASPEYLRRRGVPRTPQELAHHEGLRLRLAGTRLRPMALIDPTQGDKTIEVELPVVMVANHTDAVLRATLDGAGISSQPSDLLSPWLRSGQLQRVLAPWITARINLRAALPSRKFLPARTRAFVEYLSGQMQTSIAALADSPGAGVAGT